MRDGLVVLLLCLLGGACSLAFRVEDYARGWDGDGGELGVAGGSGGLSGGGTAGGTTGGGSSGGGGAGLAVLLVARDTTDTFIASFSLAGQLLSVTTGPALNASRSGVGRIGGEVVAVNDSSVARAPAQSLTAWQLTAASARPLTGGFIAVTAHGALSGPGEDAARTLTGAPWAGAGLAAWRTVGTFGSERSRTTLVATDAFVIALGGRDASGDPSDLVEVAPLSAGPQAGGFTATSSLPREVERPAVTLSGAELYVCGGRLESGSSDECAVAAVRANGTLESFRPLPDLPNPMSGGVLVRSARRLHLLGASNSQVAGHRRLAFVLELDAPQTGWITSSVRLPEEVELAQAAQLTP